MAELEDKENRSPVRLMRKTSPTKSSSPPKPSKKARSRSIGPEELEATRRKSPDRGRRRSAMTQIIQLPPKGILPPKDEEQKRKEARRKSLANRRVSFAPEATLHTWDVIEYMRDATTSSAASSGGRPSFAATPARQAWEQESDPPSTPPEQADDEEDLPSSPEHQRDIHQKKRRRSSAIPPMNFNNPNDEFSSSPASGSSMVEGSSDVDEEEDDDGEYDSELDEESTAMSLDAGDNTVQSEETESTDSSLTARLRQASEMAGTRGIDFDEHGGNHDDNEEDVDENGDMSMEMVTQEVTHAFKPWAQQSYGPPPMAKNIIALQDQENINPFSPAFRHAYSDRKPQGVPSTVGEETEPGSEDMSMDITRAVGGILPPTQPQFDQDVDNDMSMDITRAIGGILNPPSQQQLGRVQEVDHDQDDNNDMSMDMTRALGGILPPCSANDDTQDLGDETMDFTQAIGNIVQPQQTRAQQPRSAMKRRLSTTDDGSPHTTKPPVQPPQRRTVAQVSAKRRRSSAQRLSLGDATMDFTMAVGGIQRQPSPVKEDRRASLRRRRSSAMSSFIDEQTMDFTTAIGGIREAPALLIQDALQEDDGTTKNEELSNALAHQATTPEPQSPSTPKAHLSPAKTEVPTTPPREGHFREAEDQSAKKLLTPMFEKQVGNSAVKDSAGSRKLSPRKNIASPDKSPARPQRISALQQREKEVISTPRSDVPTSSRKSPTSARTRAGSNQLSATSPSEPYVPARKSPSSARKRRQSVAHIVPETNASSEPSAEEETTQSFSPPHDHEMPDAIVGDVVYPTLPIPEAMPSPVQTVQQPLVTPHLTNTHTVSEAGSPRPISIGTPEQIDLESANPTSPSVDKQIRSSPFKKAMTPQQQATPEVMPLHTPQQLRSSSTRQSATPQQTRSSSMKKSATPRQLQSSPVRSALTPQQAESSPLTSVPTPQQAQGSTVTPQQQPASQELAVTPQQPAPTSEEQSRAFSNSIRLMSTPRKDTGTTPLKRLRGMTPMKSPAKKAITPRKMATPKMKTPQAAPTSTMAELAGQQLAQELFAATKTGQQIPKIKLNDFLDMAGIKFMDLALPTKRRFTVAPTSSTPSRHQGDDSSTELLELESAIVAGACTMPMLDLFQHSCRELKRYISEGKSFVKTLESEVYADPPPLISAYVSASAQKKAEMDSHMRDIKINARLGSKEIWYDWRSKLLDGLEDGLKKIKSGFEQDARVLGEREQLLETLLPDLLAKHETLSEEAVRLEEAAAATSEEEKEELDAARESLVDVNAQIEERKRMIASFQQDLEEQDSLVEAYAEGKAECLAQIQEAERVKESCRGWSIDEVAALKASVSALESQTGWSITSATGSTLTMTYRSTLALFFDTSAFIMPGTSATKSENQPISLTYVGGSDSASSALPAPQPASALQTETRFFLQLMRAHLQCLPQPTTPVSALLKFVSGGWDIAVAVSEAIRRLRIEYPVRVNILSDERLGVSVDVLLPKVQTKVRVSFEISAAIVGGGGGEEETKNAKFEVGAHVSIKGKVLYGEAYNERNMEGFLGRRCGGFGEGWDEAVRELRVKLVATGRKG